MRMPRLNAHAYLHVVTYLMIAALLIIGARSYGAILTQQHSQCHWYLDVGNVATSPVAVSAATHKASKIGIAAIADSRAAFRGLGCPGQLEQPGPSFSHWAKVYGLPSD